MKRARRAVLTGVRCRSVVARGAPLKDVHWAAGAIGYFPSYTLGALAAAQLFACARVELADGGGDGGSGGGGLDAMTTTTTVTRSG